VTGLPRRRWLAVLAAALAALLVAAAGSAVTDIGPWYQALRKPAWQPPDWAFGPIWTLVFALWATALYLAWRNAGARRGRIVVLFAANGSLNVLWSWLFFGLQRPDWALMEVVALWLSVALLIVALVGVSKTAAWLLAPYLLWVSVAAALNLAVVRLNAPFT